MARPRILARQIAIDAGRTRYSTNKACAHGHFADNSRKGAKDPADFARATGRLI